MAMQFPKIVGLLLGLFVKENIIGIGMFEMHLTIFAVLILEIPYPSEDGILSFGYCTFEMSFVSLYLSESN